ncbi:MAG: lamin tail domain-containing protein [Candidatus Nealsonbacteria bacterium]
MKLKILFFFFSVFLGLTLASEVVQATNPFDIVINEVAWMGTSVSYNDEWIELYNNNDFLINLDGWILKAVDGTPEIILSGTIQPNGFYVLERTDDNSIPNITANQIYVGSLNNNGEYLKLFDIQNNLIDELNCINSWFAGDNTTKQTMERVSPSSSDWKTSKNPLGTPGTINSALVQQESQQEQESVPEPKPIQEPEQQTEEIIYPLNIVFSEILPSPEGADSENEWIEIFNKNDFDVDLSNWQIKDSVGSMTTYTFPKNSIIKTQNYLVLLRPETKIILNNDADSLSLIQPNSAIIDTISYQKAPRAQSYNLTNSGWFWSEKTTPGNNNFIEQKSEEPKKLIIEELVSKIENKDILKDSEKMLATVKKQSPNSNEFLNIYLIALILALFSGVVILVLKKQLKKSKIDF